MRMFGRACAVLTMVLASDVASANDVADKLTEKAFGPVACQSKSLTVCQDESCFVLFDETSNETMLFDFARKTYVNPMLGIETKPMKDVEVEEANEHYSAKFSIDLVGGPANVNFISNQQKNRSFKMSAASRYAYPKTGNHAQVVGITAMACQKAAPLP